MIYVTVSVYFKGYPDSKHTEICETGENIATGENLKSSISSCSKVKKFSKCLGETVKHRKIMVTYSTENTKIDQ